MTTTPTAPSSSVPPEPEPVLETPRELPRLLRVGVRFRHKATKAIIVEARGLVRDVRRGQDER